MFGAIEGKAIPLGDKRKQRSIALGRVVVGAGMQGVERWRFADHSAEEAPQVLSAKRGVADRNHARTFPTGIGQHPEHGSVGIERGRFSGDLRLAEPIDRGLAHLVAGHLERQPRGLFEPDVPRTGETGRAPKRVRRPLPAERQRPGVGDTGVVASNKAGRRVVVTSPPTAGPAENQRIENINGDYTFRMTPGTIMHA